MELKKGKIYLAIQDVIMGDLLANKRYVFIGERSEHLIYDRLPEYLVSRRYHFFDEEKQIYCEWVIDGKEDHQELTLPKYLQETEEGWTRPKAGEVIALPLASFDLTRGKELLRDHLPYFKAIVEGEEGLENIFMWMERYDVLLSQLTGKEKLGFRMKPFSSICYWLDYFTVPYTINNKFSWLDG